MFRRKKRKPKVSKQTLKSAKTLKEMGFHIPVETHQKKHPPVLRPFIWLEKRIWEPWAAWADRQALLSLLGVIGNASILFALLTYAATEKQRRDEVVFTAWQTITNAEGQPGSGGRIKALEFLNASPGANWRRRAICLWLCTWPAEDLSGITLEVEPLENLQPGTQLDASEDEEVTEQRTQSAYLRGIQLPNASLISANLQSANLIRANLQDANLIRANLQDAVLEEANLQSANLIRANLQDAYLGRANLQNAVLEEANLQGAIFLATDLRGTRSLVSQQLIGEASPHLCNTALPDTLADIDPNRDCETLPQLIAERYSIPLDDQRWVQKAMEKQWD